MTEGRRTNISGRMVVAGIVIALALVGIGYRIFTATETKSRLEETYPRLERLMAIYSVLSWRSSAQQPPSVTESSQYGGSEFQFECPHIKWGSGGFDRSDALFSCFALAKKRFIAAEGKEIDSSQFAGGEEWTYTFSWESLFGYQLNVRVSGYEGLEKENKLRAEREACLEEMASYSDRFQACSFNTYQVTLEGLTAGKSVSFITADGTLVRHPDGSVSRKMERVIYFEDFEPISVGQVNEVVQKTIRAMNITELDLSRVAPQLESMWMSKDEVFLNALIAEIDKIPDLTNLSKFIQGR